MFRRARLSVKPNVKPGGRAAAPAPSGDGNAAEAPPEPVPNTEELPTQNRDVDSQDSPAEVTIAGAATLPVSGEGREETTISDAGGSTKPLVTALQRRKRISTTPNLAKPRGSLPLVHQAGTAAPNSSQERPSEPHSSSSAPIQNVFPHPEKSCPEASPKSPAKTVPFQDQGHVLPEKKTPIPQVPHFSPFKKSVRKELNICTSAERRENEMPQKDTLSPLKERPSQASSDPGEITVCPRPASTKKIQRGSDRERIVKAHRLRELLREQVKKERKLWREKHPIYESNIPVDRSKMIMRDFIYYLPDSNPMKSSFMEEKKFEKFPSPVAVKETEIRSTPPEPEDEEVEEEAVEEDGESSLLVPRVKVAEDGSIILDEESLTVEVLRTKGPAVVEENDPIFERGSTTTYSSFRKSSYSKPWSNTETDMFFLAISMVGTDFSMIGQLFPHRARTEIKNKFKREERSNGWRIDKAFREKQPFDLEFFAQLLEKVLAEEKRKKERSAKIKNTDLRKPAKSRRKQKAKAIVEDDDFLNTDLETAVASDTEAAEVDARSAEKENEESLSIHEGQAAVEPVRARKKRKKKKKDEDGNESMAEKPSKGNGVSPKSPSMVERAKNKQEASAAEYTGDGGSSMDSWRKPECLEDQVALLEPKESQFDLPGSDETENGSKLHSSTSKQGSLSEYDELAVSEASKFGRSQILRPSKSEIKGSSKRNREEVGAATCVAKTQNVEVCDQLSLAEDDSAAGRSQEAQENEDAVTCRPVRAVRGCLHGSKPNLAQTSGKGEVSSHPEPSEVAVKNAAKGDALNVTMEETTEKKNEDTATDLKTNEASMSSEETKQNSLRPAQLLRARSQKPKPNLGRTAGREEVASVERAAAEESMENGPLQENEGHSILPSLNCSPNEVEQGHSTCSSLSEHPLAHFGEADFSQKDEVANLELDIQIEQNSSLVDSVRKEATEEPFRSDEEPSPQERSKQDAQKSIQLTRSQFQRPKPNLGRASGRKEASVAEKDAVERLTEAGHADQSVTELQPSACFLSSLDHTSLTLEQSPFLLDDSKCLNLTQKGNGSNGLHSLQKLPGSMGKAESEEMADVENIIELAAKEHLRSDEEPDSPCQNKGDAPKPGLLRRGRFQRPKPNLGRAVGRKEALPTEVVVVEKHQAEKSGTLPDDGSNCSSLPTSQLTSLTHEQAPFLLDNSKNINLTQTGKGSKRLPSPQKSPGSMDKTELEEMANKDNALELEKESEHLRFVEEPDIPCQNIVDALKPGQFTRGRFQRPKPNLGRAAKRKETPLAEVATVEKLPETEKSGTLPDDSSGCWSVPSSQCTPAEEQSPCLLDDSKCTDLRHKGKESERLKSPQKSPGSMGKPESEEMANVADVLELAEKEHLRPDEETDDPCQSKGDAQKPNQLTRGRFQRPKPNFVRAARRKEALLVEAALEKSEAEKSGTLPGDSSGFSSLPSSHHTPPAQEQSPFLLDDSKCTDLIPKKGKGSKRLPSPQKSPGSMGKPESEEMADVQNVLDLAEKEHVRSDEEPDIPCPNKGDAPKPGQLRRGQFQRPKPNLGRAAGRKEAPLAEVTAVEKPQAEKSGTLPDDGSSCSSLPISHASEHEGDGPLLSFLSPAKCELLNSVQEELPAKGSWSETMQQPARLMESKDEVEQREESQLAHAVGKTVELSPRSREKTSPQPESKLSTLKPAPLRRGRFQRPKPNLERAAERKGTEVAEKGAVKEMTDAGTAVKHVEGDCSSDPTQDGVAKSEDVVVSPSAEMVNSEEVTLISTTSKSLNNIGLEDHEFTEHALSTDEQGKTFEADVRTNIKLIAQAESTANILQPTKLVRGKFLKPKPNLRRAAGRKDVSAAEKNENESLLSSSPSSIDSDTLPSKEHIPANEKEALLEETSKQRSSEGKALTPTECRGTSQVDSMPQSQSETAEKFAHKSSSQEECKQGIIKPVQLAKGRFQKAQPKPELDRAAGRREIAEQGNHISGNKTESKLLEDSVQSTTSSKELSLLTHSSCTEEMPFISQMCKRKNPKDLAEERSLKRSRLLCKPQPPTASSENENETSTEQEEDMPASSAQEPAPDQAARLRREYKQPEPVKGVPAFCPSASKSDVDCAKRKKPKTRVPKSRGSKSHHSKNSGKGHKTTLVTLRALQEEDEDDDGDGDLEQDYEEESYHLPPEEVNKAPVFVPRSLRSPNPVPAEIEETLEEFEIAADIIDADCISDTELQPGVQEEIAITDGNHNTSIEAPLYMASYPATEEETETDGSTEAAMTLLAMRNPMFQSRMNMQGTTFVFNGRGELKDVTPALLNQYNVEPEVTPISSSFTLSIINGEPPFPSEHEDHGPSEEKSSEVVVDTAAEIKNEASTPSDLTVPKGKIVVSMTRDKCLIPNLDRALEKPKTKHQKSASNEADPIGSQEQSDIEDMTSLGSTAVQDPDKIACSSVHLHESGPSNAVRNDRLEEPIQENEAKTESSTLAGSPRTQTYEPESVSTPYQNSEALPPEEDTHLYTNSSCIYNLEQLMSEQQNSEIIQYQHAIPSMDQTAEDLITHDYLKEEETIILTLVEIPIDSVDGYHDSGAALSSEHMLLAPVVISPVPMELTEGQSTGSMMTAIDKHTMTSDNQLSLSEFQMEASVMSVSELRPVSRKRAACETEESDVPHAKKIQPYLIKQDSEINEQEGDKNDQGHVFGLKIAETPLDSTSNHNHEELQFPKEEAAAVCGEIIVHEEPLVSLQNLDTSQLRVTLADADKTPPHDQAAGTSSKTYCKGQNLEAEQDLESTRLKQSHESSVSMALSPRETLTRPGRKPRGFLSLICNNSCSGNEKDTKSNSRKIQKPHIPTPKPCLKSRTSSSKDDIKVPCCPAPENILSTVGDSRVCEEETSGPSTVFSRDECQKETFSSCQESQSEGGPTRVSEYFFSDIFMEVDEQD